MGCLTVIQRSWSTFLTIKCKFSVFTTFQFLLDNQGGIVTPPPPPSAHGGVSFSITFACIFPPSGNLHSTLHCNALHSPSDRTVYLNIVEKGINMFQKRGF